MKYEHRVLGYVNHTLVPISVNIDTVKALFPDAAHIQDSKDMDEWLAKEQTKYDHELVNLEEMAKSRVGPRLYELIFKPYTFKQWAKYPEELGPEVTARIPVRNDHDDRYFPNDVHQALPSEGYTKFFESLLVGNDKIDLFLNTDYFDVKGDRMCVGQVDCSPPPQ